MRLTLVHRLTGDSKIFGIFPRLSSFPQKLQGWQVQWIGCLINTSNRVYFGPVDMHIRIGGAIVAALLLRERRSRSKRDAADLGRADWTCFYISVDY
jgi:hypothetical protein